MCQSKDHASMCVCSFKVKHAYNDEEDLGIKHFQTVKQVLKNLLHKLYVLVYSILVYKTVYFFEAMYFV